MLDLGSPPPPRRSSVFWDAGKLGSPLTVTMGLLGWGGHP